MICLLAGSVVAPRLLAGEMKGRVVVVGKNVKESASASQAPRAPNTAADAPGTMNPHPVGENVRERERKGLDGFLEEGHGTGGGLVILDG